MARTTSEFSPNPLQILFKKSAIACVDDAETDVITDARRGIWRVCNKLRTNKVVYRMEDDQLLRLWSVVRCFGVIREITDPVIKSEILTKAQILLTDFVLELQPLPGDQAHLCDLETGRRH